MTSPQPPRPQNRVTAGAVNEETLHLPLTTPGPAVPVPGSPAPPVTGPPAPAAPVTGAPAAPRTAPSPYPARPAFRAPLPPPPGDLRPQPAASPKPRPAAPEHWEGLGFRPDIQGLRAVAVVLVLLSHAGFSLFSGGYVGVDVFFVLSGFLITSLLVKEVFDTGKISIAGFYARRARRILPAATAVTVATVIGAWLWFPITRLEAVMQDAFTVVVYVVNYRFIAQESEYLNADQMPSPFQQYWSLAVEEQFYLVWPLLLIGLMFLVGRSPRKFVGAAAAACTAVFAISLVLSVLVTQQSQPTAYYAAHTRAWELAAGALLALTLPLWKKTPRALAWILGIAGLAAIIASGVLYDEMTPFPGYTAMLPVLGTMLVIVAGSGPGANPASALLHTKPFQFVGKISYSLYLWHWPLLILIPLAVGAESSLVLNVCLILGTFALAQLSYQYIEEPVRRAKPFKSGNLWGLSVGVVCSVVGIAMIVSLAVAFPKVPSEEPPVDLEAVEEVQDVSEIELRLQEGLTISSVPDDLEPSLTGAGTDEPKLYGNGCHLNVWDSDLPDDCVFGDADSGTTVYLVGDSHAAQWFPALEPIAEKRGWRLVTRTKSACTPVSVAVYNREVAGEYTVCEDWREAVFDELDEIRPDLVILGGEDSPPIADGEDDGPQRWEEGWADTLDRVTAAAGETVILTDTPRHPRGQRIPECLSLHENEVEQCVMDRSKAIDDTGNREAGMAAQQEAGATVIETVGWFCYAGSCPVITGNILVYRDSHHMSTPYARSLTMLLEDELPTL